ncbi:MAG: recombinase family protein [Deltaproteobacteria bacterium]|nr:recombinase family protein [Deltaproteobacteria bacterium]
MVADFGNEAHAARTIRGLQSRALDDFSTGRKPYGYGSEATKREVRKGKEVLSHYKIFIIPHEAEVIRRIFQLYAEGYGKIYIVKKLNSEGVPPPTSRASAWQHGPISRILSNERYIGRWIYGRTYDSRDPETGKRVTKQRPRSQWIIKDREELRIIDQDLWEAVQKRLADNLQKRKTAPHGSHKKIFGSFNRIDNRHLLSGVIACPKCLGNVNLVSGRRGGYYGCVATYRKGNCDWRTLIRRQRAEKAIIEYLKNKLISDESLIQYATQTYNEMVKKYLRQAPNKKKDLDKELGDLNKEINHLIDFITKGNASNVEAVTEALRQREDRKLKVQQQISNLNQTEDKAKFLATPYSVRHRLEEAVNTIEDAGDKYCSLLPEIFEGPLVPEETQGGILLKGTLNLGQAMIANKGSRHCTIASPTGVEPVSPP